MNITRAFELAKRASEFSDCKIKVGCVITYKNKVISVGYNTSKSHPLQKQYNVYRGESGREYDVDVMNNGLHAEGMAIRTATRLFKEDYSKLNIFVYSEKKDGSTRLSKPCRACSQFIKDIGIKNVYYTMNSDSFAYGYERF